MEPIKYPIAIATSVMLIYLVSTMLGLIYAVVFSLFLASNFFLIWMVIRVLKDGEPSPYTFKDRWYEDKQR